MMIALLTTSHSQQDLYFNATHTFDGIYMYRYRDTDVMISRITWFLLY